MFRSFFMGGFECSCHRRADGVRLDISAASGHARFAQSDYEALRGQGMATARDGLRWHLIETTPGRYDWSSWLPMLRAARKAGVQVVWDLCHYGWPDDIDIWSGAFVERFARFAGAAASVLDGESDETPIFCPVNEISFWSWAGGEVGQINPVAHGWGVELKRQLVRAALAAIEAVRSVNGRARFLFAEPAIHVDGGLGSAEHRAAAEAYRLAQFEAFDMIAGRAAPSLGGGPDHLDVVGVNFYPDNQWYLHGGTIPLGHHAYRPFADLLCETYERYGRPMIVAETGAEGSARAAWLHYVTAEVAAARERGARIEGICLYPVLDCPGWIDGRVCPVGLFSTPDARGRRQVYGPLARELAAAQRLAGGLPLPGGRREPGRPRPDGARAPAPPPGAGALRPRVRTPR